MIELTRAAVPRRVARMRNWIGIDPQLTVTSIAETNSPKIGSMAALGEGRRAPA